MRAFLFFVLVALVAAPASAAVFSDATGETFTGAGGGILDIVSVEVTNTPTDITFKLTLNADVVATDWGKYMIGIDSAPGGHTTGNGWNRPISMLSGMDYWLGSWVDGGNGGEVWKYNAGWGLQSATYASNPDNLSISKSGSTVTIKTDLAGLGLASGGAIAFDVYSSGGGGGDGAIDALGNDNQTVSDWGNSYDSGANVETYNVVVPEPASLGLVAIAAAALFRRRRN